MPCFQGEEEYGIPALQAQPCPFGSLVMQCSAAWLAVATAVGASAVVAPGMRLVVHLGGPSSAAAGADPEAAASLAPADPQQRTIPQAAPRQHLEGCLRSKRTACVALPQASRTDQPSLQRALGPAMLRVAESAVVGAVVMAGVAATVVAVVRVAAAAEGRPAAVVYL